MNPTLNLIIFGVIGITGSLLSAPAIGSGTNNLEFFALMMVFVSLVGLGFNVGYLQKEREIETQHEPKEVPE